jgi:hypothetical protein
MGSTRRTVLEGLLVGLIAYAAVAVFYAVIDLLAARGLLFTVNLLGQAMFRAQRDPTILQYPMTLDLPAIFWYNGFHLVTSLAIGLIVVGLIDQAERHPTRARPALLVIVAGFLLTIVVVDRLTAPVRDLLPGWSIVVANGLAVVVAGWYLASAHRGIGRRLLGLSVGNLGPAA